MELKMLLFTMAEKLIIHRRKEVRKNKIREIKFKSSKDADYIIKN